METQMNNNSIFLQEQDRRVTTVMENTVISLKEFIAVTNNTVRSAQDEVNIMMEQTKQFSLQL